MRNLKSKRDKKRYKDTSHWLDAVYRNNKLFIDEKLKDVKTKNKKRVFKNLVLEQTGTKFKGSLTNKELNEKNYQDQMYFHHIKKELNKMLIK